NPRRMIIERVIVLPPHISPRFEVPPGSGGQLVILLALAFGDDVRLRCVRAPAAEHVPDDEVHHRVLRCADAKRVTCDAVAEHAEIPENEADSKPSPHGTTFPGSFGPVNGLPGCVSGLALGPARGRH